MASQTTGLGGGALRLRCSLVWGAGVFVSTAASGLCAGAPAAWKITGSCQAANITEMQT